MGSVCPGQLDSHIPVLSSLNSCKCFDMYICIDAFGISKQIEIFSLTGLWGSFLQSMISKLRSTSLAACCMMIHEHVWGRNVSKFLFKQKLCNNLQLFKSYIGQHKIKISCHIEQNSNNMFVPQNEPQITTAGRTHKISRILLHGVNRAGCRNL